MIHAELKNKCCGSEDALTSTVFGYLKYSCFREELKEFFSHATNLQHDKFPVPDWLDKVGSDSFKFWERLTPDKEPDLRLEKSKDECLIIEVKFSSTEQENQLGKYLFDAGDKAKLIYITMDATLDAAMKFSINPASEYNAGDKTRIYWLSWHYLHKVLSDSSKDIAAADDTDFATKQQMGKDLLQYLEKRGIRSFQGFTNKKTVKKLPRPIFWTPTCFIREYILVQKLIPPIFWEAYND